MKTLWFSYSMEANGTLDTPRPNRSPYAWTWTVGRFLRAKAAEIGYAFEYRNLDDDSPAIIGKDDLVIGHWWNNDGSFIRQAFVQDCKAKFILQPYTHNMVGPEALPSLCLTFDTANHLFLVCGPYWYDTMPDTGFARWHEKSTRLDNHADPAAHPFLKRRWGKAGKRRALAIGYDNPIKGMDIVADIGRMTGLHIGVYGTVSPALFRHTPNAVVYQGRAFTPDVIQELVDEYDFFITCGRFDANPTTLNETACWGLIGACTTGSGYWPDEPFYELRTNDMLFNMRQIERLQHMSEYDLWARARAMRALMETHYTSERACDTIWTEMSKWL